jgi:hypothetical protein
MGAQIILVVEDEIILRMFIAESLRDEGYQVLEAGAEEALTILDAGIEVDQLMCACPVQWTAWDWRFTPNKWPRAAGDRVIGSSCA